MDGRSHGTCDVSERTVVSGSPAIQDLRWPASVSWFDLTLQTPAENLALDEALLDQVELDSTRASLRFWEPASPFVVIGRSNHIATEVNEDRCLAENIPILRRTSGGGAVVMGPGCLAYALALPLTADLKACGVSAVTRAVMETIAGGLNQLIPGTMVCGVSDLVAEDRKFSGNAQRWQRQAFLHHGTVLYNFPLGQVEDLLKSPTRQPDYRSNRLHRDFIANVPASRENLMGAIVSAWNGQPAVCSPEVLDHARSLVETRYSRDDWNRHGTVR